MITKIANRLGSGIDSLSDLAGRASALLAILASITICYEVIARYIFNRPTLWQFEIVVYLAIWLAFLGLSFGLKERSHVRMDALIVRLSPKTQAILEVFSYILIAVFSLLMVYYGVSLMLKAFHLQEKSIQMLSAPIWVMRLAIPLGMFLLSLQAVKMLIAKCRSLKRQLGRLSNRSLLLLPLLFAFTVFLCWLWPLSPVVVLLVLLFALLLTGLPVAFTLGLLGCVGYYYLIGGMSGLITAPFKAYATLDNYNLIALPLFMLAGQIMAQGKIANQLFEFSAKWIGHLPGGLAIVTLAASTIFSAISGSSVANAAAMGIIAIPLMLSKGYDIKLAAGVVAAGGTIDLMIPPSNSMMMYGILAEESIGKLFMAGLIPGMMLTLLFIPMIVYLCRKGGYEPIPAASWKERLLVTRGSFGELLIPIFILVGIYTGIFTPTEAAGVAVVYCLVLSLVKKTIKWQDLPELLKSSARGISFILMIIVGAMFFGDVANMLQVPQSFSQAIAAANLPNWSAIGMMMVLLLILGFFLEGASIQVLTVPILAPVIVSLGYSHLWFAVLMTLMIQIGLLTPPVGLNLFVVQGVSNARLEDIIRGVAPFLLLLAIGVVILAFVPQLSLWLPSTMTR